MTRTTKNKEKDDIQALNKELEQDNLEQDNEHSTTTQESVFDDENEVVIIGDEGKDNEEHDILAANGEQHKQAERTTLKHKNKMKDAVAVQRKEGGSHYKRIYG